MINSYYKNKNKETLGKIKKLNPVQALKDKEAKATAREKKQLEEIKANLRIFAKNKDSEGALKYLAHLKKNELNNANR